MDLSSLKREKRMRAPKIVIYSGPKAGKSTWASQAPDPIFIQCEEGLDALDVTAFPLAEKLTDVLEAIKALWEQDHNFKTVVVDSLDWLQPLIWDSVCQSHKIASIEALGFGKGYVECDKIWRQILDGLDYLRNKKGMCVILIAHAEKRMATPPDGEPFEYAALKLHKRAAAIVEEWADVIGYATDKRIVKTTDAGFNKTTRAITKGDRVLVVGRNPAYVTGNRYGLPDELPLNFGAFADALNNIK